MFPRRLISFLVVVAAVIASLSHSSRKDSRPHERLPPAHSQDRVFTGKVVSIADGDTVTVLDDDDRQHRIRVFGIDAPEKDQAFGRRSKENIGKKIFGKTVRVEVVDVDRYGREVGRIYLGDRFINREQVEDGYAWRYRTFDRRGEFEEAEADARSHRRGLWADSNPVPPWDYRREHHVGANRQPRQSARPSGDFEE